MNDIQALIARHDSNLENIRATVFEAMIFLCFYFLFLKDSLIRERKFLKYLKRKIISIYQSLS